MWLMYCGSHEWFVSLCVTAVPLDEVDGNRSICLHRVSEVEAAFSLTCTALSPKRDSIVLTSLPASYMYTPLYRTPYY